MWINNWAINKPEFKFTDSLMGLLIQMLVDFKNVYYYKIPGTDPKVSYTFVTVLTNFKGLLGGSQKKVSGGCRLVISYN